MYNADYAVAIICLSVHLSVTRWYYIETAKHTFAAWYRYIAPLWTVFRAKWYGNIYSDGEHLTGASNALREYEKIAILDRFISETIQDRAIVTVKYQ